MAKAKKKKELSLEEKLEQALVPVDEQPYEIPKNWCWTYLRNIAQWGSGGTPSRKNTSFYEGNIPWVKTGELEDAYLYDTEEKISEEAIKKSSAKLFPLESVLIAMYGATIGKTAILGIEASTNQACACAICNKSVYNKYLFYYLRSQKDKFIEQGKGGAQPNISQEIIKNNYIPIPPKEEQKRIVEQIENLFAKLDEAKEKIQITLEQAEKNKSSVLQEALSGNLTKVWRKEKHYADNEWESVTFGEILRPVKDKYDPTSDDKLDIPYIGLEHIEKGKGICSHGSPEEVKSLKTLFKKGDLLYGKLRPYLNKHDVATFNGMCSTDILVYRAQDITTAKYMNYLMSTIDFMEYAVENSSGINLPRTSEKVISAYNMKISNVDEQAEIVRILEVVLKKQEEMVCNCENILEQIELIKKSILAKAFRGKLGTNNANEESAVELLKSILANE